MMSGAASPSPARPSSPASLTAVRGLSVGHWTDLARATGCTVVLAPEGGMRGACAVRGRATGTRELDALHPRHLVGHVDAILLTGGSAYGLGAADGVMRWLRERGRGFPVGPASVVPIVPTAVIFDFDLAPGSKADRWPTADDAYRACAAAGSDIAEGTVGAGTGATVGKVLGPRRAMKGGVGTWASRGEGDVVVGALVVPPRTPLQVEALAALAVPEAVERAVRLARGVRDIPGLADGGGKGVARGERASRARRLGRRAQVRPRSAPRRLRGRGAPRRR